MSGGKRNMEEFLRSKLNDLEPDFQNDWDVFEQKLERALFFKRLRVGAALAIFLIATSIGIFGTSSIISFHQYPDVSFGIFDENGYQNAGTQSEWKSTSTVNQQNVLQEMPEANPKGAGLAGITTQAGSEAIKRKEEKVIRADLAVDATAKGQAVESGTLSEGAIVSVSGNGGKAPAEATAVNSTAAGQKVTGVQKANERRLNSNTVTSNVNTAPASTSDPAGQGGDPGSPVYTSLGEYQHEKDEPIPTKIMKLELEPLSAMAGEGALAGLQVRMSAPSLKAESKSPGPYISPLEEKSPWEFSIKVYPNFTFRKFKVDEDKANLIHRDFIDQVRVSESGGFSLNIGFEVSRRIGPATYLNSGLEYISYKTSAHFDFINYRTANIDPNTGAIMNYTLMDEPEGIVINDQNTYHYLNVPLSIAYKPWASEHIRLNVEAGISYMHFVAARGRSIDYRTLEIIDLSDRTFRSSMGSLNLRVGATYYISPQFNLGFEPTFVYFTNTIYTEEYPFEVIPYSVGLNLKLQVKLN